VGLESVTLAARDTNSTRIGVERRAVVLIIPASQKLCSRTDAGGRCRIRGVTAAEIAAR
jgi:hypothetical protein